MFKIKAFIKSLFSDKPQRIGMYEFYFRKGKRISAYQLFLEEYEKSRQAIKSRIESGPNIQL